MPMQEQNSSFAAKLGGRVAAANAEQRGKPIDTGMRRLPPGIRNGVAKLQFMYTRDSEKDDGVCPKGMPFFRASAVCLGYLDKEGNLEEYFGGEKISGIPTSVVIPLCDVPAKVRDGKEVKEAVSFEENWNKFRSLFCSLGIEEPPYDGTTDPDSKKTEAYYFAAMKALTDTKHPGYEPVYINFSTRGWKLKRGPNESEEQYKKREEMVFESWHGRADWDGKYDPGAGVTEAASTQPPVRGTSTIPQKAPVAPVPIVQPSSNGPAHSVPSVADRADLDEEVTRLVAIAMDDPELHTEEGAFAGERLEELAVANGWSEESVNEADSWEVVGDMAINPPGSSEEESQEEDEEEVSIGSRWLYVKRGRNGQRLKTKEGKEFAPVEVTVASVDRDAQTCTLKTTDGRDVLEMRTKHPAVVKWEWLEPLPAY